MPRLTSTLSPSFGGLRERECPRCHRTVDLPLGALCDACRREIDTRARRIARWVSLVTTAAFGAYAMAVLPLTQSARLVGAAATLVWFIVVRRVTVQVVRVWLEERPDKRDERDDGMTG